MLLQKLFRNASWQQVSKFSTPDLQILPDLFKHDKNIRKVNLSFDSYHNDSNKPHLFESVQKAKSLIFQSPDHEYLPIDGLASFNTNASLLAFGQSTLLKENRVVTMQTIGGTGATSLSLAFINRFYPHTKTIYIPNLSRPSHSHIISTFGLNPEVYTYYNNNSKSIDIEGLLDSLDSAPKNSIFLFHASGHNPTGADPTPDQWGLIQDAMATKQHLALFDLSYQGLVSGDVDKDAYAVRLFAREENPMIVIQSFSANFGIYGERAGSLSVVCDNKFEAEKVLSQLKMLARATYSNPALFGARVVSTVLSNPELKKLWSEELKKVSERLKLIRGMLVDRIKERGSQHDWSHILKQSGLYSYTGIGREHAEELIEKHHIYVGIDGRISVAGLNRNNIDYVAEAFDHVTKFTRRI